MRFMKQLCSRAKAVPITSKATTIPNNRMSTENTNYIILCVINLAHWSDDDCSSMLLTRYCEGLS